MSLRELFKHYTGRFHHANFSGSKTRRRKRRLFFNHNAAGRWNWLWNWNWNWNWNWSWTSTLGSEEDGGLFAVLQTLLLLALQLLPALLLLVAVVFLPSPASAITLPVAMPPSHPRHFLTVVGQDSNPSTTTTTTGGGGGGAADGDPTGPALASNRVPFAAGAEGEESQQVGEDEVMYHFYKNGRLGAGYHRKASTVFMVRLFNDLLRGGVSPGQRHHRNLRRRRPPPPPPPSGVAAPRGGNNNNKPVAWERQQQEGESGGVEEELPFTDTIRSFSAGGKGYKLLFCPHGFFFSIVFSFFFSFSFLFL